MTKKEDIKNIIFDSIDEVNENRADKPKIIRLLSTRLFGKKSTIDSLGLVSLIVTVEQNIEEKLGIAITLADERAMSQKSSPFKTIESLIEYVILLIDEAKTA